MIELKNICKTFNRTGNALDARVVLDHVNLTINDGEFVTVIGGNGSGKTTTMNIMCGTVSPDEGHVVLSGMDITKMKEHQRAKYFGRVFQDPMMGTTAEMSCLENLELSFRRGKARSPFKWGFSNHVVKLYFRNILSEFGLGLEDRLDQKVGVMSGGQRQALTLLMAATDSRIDTRKEFIKMHVDVLTGPLRAEISSTLTKVLKKSDPKKYSDLKKELSLKLKEEKARLSEESGRFYDEHQREYENSIIKAQSDDDKLNAYLKLSNELHDYNQDRRILLLDEHTAALDPKTAKKVLELTDKIVREKHLTTLMITHNMKDALTYGDRLIMFDEGHIIYDISGEEKKKLTVEDLLKKFDEAKRIV